MSQPPHFTVDGTVYFVTTRIDQIRRHLSPSEMKLIEKTILNLEKESHYLLFAYTVMPDHLHLLFKPLRSEISKAMQMVKGRSSRMINKGRLWQKGFYDVTLYSEDKFRQKFNYIHYNPVKRGLVKRAEDYQFSSAMRYHSEYGTAFYQ